MSTLLPFTVRAYRVPHSGEEQYPIMHIMSVRMNRASWSSGTAHAIGVDHRMLPGVDDGACAGRGTVAVNLRRNLDVT